MVDLPTSVNKLCTRLFTFFVSSSCGDLWVGAASSTSAKTPFKFAKIIREPRRIAQRFTEHCIWSRVPIQDLEFLQKSWVELYFIVKINKFYSIELEISHRELMIFFVKKNNMFFIRQFYKKFILLSKLENFLKLI